MKVTRFYIKNDYNLDNLKDYGFKEESTRYITQTSVVKLCVKKQTRQLTFNMPDNDTLHTFMKMIKDDIVEVKKHNTRPLNYHYIGLSDEEYKLIQERRNNDN